MSRSAIGVRDAEPADAAALLDVWHDPPRSAVDRTPPRPPLAEVCAVIARIADDPDQRLVVAVADDDVIGAAFLSRTALSPIHAEDAVQISHLQVSEHARRHGAGKALVASAVAWAEEKGATTVLATASAQDRDANRYLARLGFSSLAILRGASVTALRGGMVPLDPPACARTNVRTSRTVAQILAQRRHQRRVKSGAGAAD